jgi:hypothetical protein
VAHRRKLFPNGFEDRVHKPPNKKCFLKRASGFLGALNDVLLVRSQSCEEEVFIREIYIAYVSLTLRYKAQKKTNWNTVQENEFYIDM